MNILSLPPMKKTAIHLFLVFLAALVFYGGAGVNLVSYCCGECRIEGTAVLLDDKCCDIHEHEHESPAGFDLGIGLVHTTSTDPACCDLERVSFDWSRFSQTAFNLQPAITELLLPGSVLTSLVPVPVLKAYTLSARYGPPVVCPRAYLSLLTILLI